MMENKLFYGTTRDLVPGLQSKIETIREEYLLQPLRVIVDSNLTGIYLRRTLAERGCSHLNLRFSTFTDLARELGDKYTGPGKKALPFYGKERVVQKIVSGMPASSYFAPVANHDGFKEALKKTFKELREAGIDKLEVKENSGERWKRLKQLYDKYNGWMMYYYDEAALYRCAQEAQFSYLDWPALILYGVHRLNRLQEDLLQKISCSLPVYVFINRTALWYPPGERQLRWFENSGFTVEHLSPQAVTSPSPGIREFLQENAFYSGSSGNSSFYEYKDSPGWYNDGFEVWSTPGEVEEAREISRRMLELAREGYTFKEMVVLVKDPAYFSLLQENFNYLGIPCYLPSGRTLDSTPAGRSLSLCLQLMNTAWPRHRVMELVSSAPFDYSRILNHKGEVSTALWDFFSLEAGITRGKKAWEKRLTRLEERLYRQARGEAGEESGNDSCDKDRHLTQLLLFKKFILKLQGAMDDFPPRDSWAGYIEGVENFIKGFFLDSPELNTLLKTLGLLRSLEHLDHSVALQEAVSLVVKVLRETSIPWGNFQKDGVTVVPLKSALNLSFAVVFMPGILEAKYPAALPQNPVLPEEDRQNYPDLSLRRENLQEEELQFISGLQTSSDRLYLSYPRRDTRTGKEQTPSHYLLRLGEMLCGRRLSLNQLEDLPGYRYIPSHAPALPEKAVTPGEYDLALAAGLQEESLFRYFREILPWWNKLQEKTHSRSLSHLTQYEGVLESAPLKESVMPYYRPYGKTISVSYLEDYLFCPHYFFLKRILQLDSLEEPEEKLKLESLDRGAIVHSVLEDFYREARQKEMLPLGEKRLDEALSLMEGKVKEHLGHLEKTMITGPSLAWRVEQEHIIAEMLEYVENEAVQESLFIPRHFEISFGEPGSKPSSRQPGELQLEKPVEILLKPSGKKLYFRGRIDRLDETTAGERLRVVDYKTGRVKFSSSGFKDKLPLQLVLYLRVAGEIFKKIPLEKMEASFIYLSRRDGFPVFTFEGETLAQKQELFLEKLDGICSLIDRGSFFPYPASSCRWCPYVMVCGPGIHSVIKYKEQDPGLQEWERLKEGLASG